MASRLKTPDGRLRKGIPRPPKAVTFDCWSTLVTDVDWGEVTKRRQASLVKIAARKGVRLDPEKAVELLESSWKEHVTAWQSGEMFGAPGAARWIMEQLAVEEEGSPSHLDDELAAELASAMEEATTEVGTRVVPGAAEALRAVRAAGIPTALICDTGFTPGRAVRRYLDEHGLVLDHYFFSDEVGSPKPYPPIFEAALGATGAEPHEAVHIGDLRRTDIAGAKRAGMGTIRFIGVHDNSPGSGSDDEEADALLEQWTDLPSLLGIAV